MDPITTPDLAEVRSRLEEAALYLDMDPGDKIVRQDDGKAIIYPVAWESYRGKDTLLFKRRPRWTFFDGYGHAEFTGGSRLHTGTPVAVPRPKI